MTRPIIILISALCLTACSTPYAKQNAFWNKNLGYRDMALGSDKYLISFRAGTGYDQPEDVLMKLFYRAAEVARDHGAQYFEVQDFSANTSVNTQVLPGWSSSSASGNVSYNPNMGYGTANVQSNGYYVPPQVMQTPVIEMRTVIKLVNNPSAEDKAHKDNLVDTAFVFENWKV